MKKVIQFLVSAVLIFSLFSCKVSVSPSVSEDDNTTITDQNNSNKTDNKDESEGTDPSNSSSSSSQNVKKDGDKKTDDDKKTDVSNKTEGTDPSDSGEASNSGNDSGSTNASDSEENKTPVPSASTKDCNVSETDLAGWSGKLIIDGSDFADMGSGDYITITTVSNNSGDPDPQLKLCLHDAENDSDATKIGSNESMSDADYLGQWLCYTLHNANQSTKFYPTDAEIELLKTKGFMLYGQGVKITSVTIRINANLDKASGNGSNGNQDSGNGNNNPQNPGDNGDVSGDVDQNATSGSTTDCEVSVTDLGTGWTSSLVIPGEKFYGMVAGDYVVITTEASSVSATPQIQLMLCDKDEGATMIGGDESITDADYSEKWVMFELYVAAQSSKFYPTETELAGMKRYGMRIKGQGVKITSVTARLNSRFDPVVVDASKIVAGTATGSLSDKNATANAKALYKYIQDVYGKKVITGQMENAWDNNFKQLNKVYADTGKYPALMGFDFMDYTGTTNTYNNCQTERAIKFWNGQDYDGNTISSNHGIVAFCWHWRDPRVENSIGNYKYEPSSGNHMDPILPYNYSTKSWNTTSDVYKGIIQDLDVVAGEFEKLQKAGVPVIWRPLHEGAGNVGASENGTAWFWWGLGTCQADMTDADKCGEAYIALWKLMYNYLTKTKGIHNLIWLWNGQNEKFYPGDDYVDMMGDDVYTEYRGQGAQNYKSQLRDFSRFRAVSPAKPLALSECGAIPSMENISKDSAWWSFFMVWNDSNNSKSDWGENFWNGEKYNTSEHKIAVYTSETAITLDELPDLTSYQY